VDRFPKIDDPDNLTVEERDKLSAAQDNVKKIWNVGCRERALKELINATECPRYDDVLPVFLPVSAKTAFLVRAGTSMTKEDFAESMDPECFSSIGLNQFGRKEWAAMRDSVERANSVHDMLRKDQQELLNMSGFDKFLQCLEKLLGGKKAQADCIRKKFLVELSKDHFEISTEMLHIVNDKRRLAGENETVLAEKVWESYQEKWKKPAIAAFGDDWKSDRLAIAATKLVEYQKFCEDIGFAWANEVAKIQEELCRLVELQVAIINNKANEWSYEDWERDNCGEDDAWRSLSPIDWQNMLSAFLMLRGEKIFCRRFGRELALLEKHQFTFQMHSQGCSEGCDSRPCPDHQSLLQKVQCNLDPEKSFEVTPLDDDAYHRLLKVSIPKDYTIDNEHPAHTGEKMVGL
jgi:hypothetical protein